MMIFKLHHTILYRLISIVKIEIHKLFIIYDFVCNKYYFVALNKNIIQAVKLDNDLRRYKIELRKFVSQKMTILKKIGLFQ
jgi:hypothetical protein